MFRNVPPGLSIIAIIVASAFAGSSIDLQQGIEQISQSAAGRVGAAFAILETGDSVAWHGDEHFPMQSVYKLPIAMAVLHQVDRGLLSLDRNIRVEKEDLVGAGQHSPIRDQYPNGGVELSVKELLRFMVSESDGSACDVLLRVVGGPGRVTAWLHQLALKDVVVADTEKAMGRDERVQYRNWATPNAMLRLLRAVHEGRGLSAPSRAYLRTLMTETGTGPHRIKGMLPAGTVVAHKTGTSGTVNGLTRATNDVGIVTLPNGQHMAVAVFVSDSRADTAACEGTIAQLARAAWDHWSGPGNRK